MPISRRALLRDSVLTAAAAAAALPALGRQKTAAAAPAAASPQLDELKRAFSTSRAFTLEMADAMPEEKYHFKPVPLAEIRTFGQQMVHIAESLPLIYQRFVENKEGGAFTEAAKEQFASKAEVRSKLERGYQYVEDAVARLKGSDLDRPTTFFGREVPVRQVIHTLLDHCTHHRAQCVVYLRLNGIKPAPYRA